MILWTTKTIHGRIIYQYYPFLTFFFITILFIISDTFRIMDSKSIIFLSFLLEIDRIIDVLNIMITVSLIKFMLWINFLKFRKIYFEKDFNKYQTEKMTTSNTNKFFNNFFFILKGICTPKNKTVYINLSTKHPIKSLNKGVLVSLG